MSKTLSKDKEREQFIKQKIKELNITEIQDIKFIKNISNNRYLIKKKQVKKYILIVFLIVP